MEERQPISWNRYKRQDSLKAYLYASRRDGEASSVRIYTFPVLKVLMKECVHVEASGFLIIPRILYIGDSTV